MTGTPPRAASLGTDVLPLKQYNQSSWQLAVGDAGRIAGYLIQLAG